MCFNLNDVRPVLAKLIINKLGCKFAGDEELQSLCNKGLNVDIFHQYLSQTSLERMIDIREQAQKFPLEPRSIKHHLLQVYDALVLYSPSDCQCNRSMVFIQFILEVCYHCVSVIDLTKSDQFMSLVQDCYSEKKIRVLLEK